MPAVSASSALRAALALVLAAAVLPRAARADNDIAVRQVTGPAQATTGHDVTLQVTLANDGANPLSGYPLGIYLSPDTALSVFDHKIGEVTGPDLAVGQTAMVAVTATIPANVAPGTWTLGIIADPMNTLGEKVATLLDNVRVVSPPTMVKAPAPDFVAEKVTWGLKAAGGEVIPVEITVANHGVLDGQASASLYLSTNATISRTDQLAGSVAISVPAGGEIDQVAWVQLPTGLAPSRYYLGLWVDARNEVAELDETNNIAVSDPADVGTASLAVETTFLPDGLVGLPYVKSLVASGGDGPYEWKLAGGTLPEGIGLSAEGLLSGTITSPGTFSPVFQVTSGSSTVQQALILRAYLPTTSLAVATTELPPAVVGQGYDAPLAAEGGTPPYSWRLASGTLPAGLALSADGHLAGKAGGEDSETFKVEVRDAAGNAAVGDLSLKAVRNAGLAIRELVLDDGTAEEAYLAKLDPDGGTAPYAWSLASGSLPNGLAFASDGTDSVTISGKPLQAGTFVFAVRLEDASGQVDRNTYVLHVAPAAVKIETASLADATRGQPYDEELTSTAAPGATWRVASGSLPPGFELTPDGHVKVTAGTVAETTPLRTYTFLLEVTDPQGGLGRGGFSIAVLSDAAPTTSTGGCASTGVGLLALVPLLALRRRRALVAAGLFLVSAAAGAQSAGYVVNEAPEANYPELGSIWIDDVSFTKVADPAVDAGSAGPDLDAGSPDGDLDAGDPGTVDAGVPAVPSPNLVNGDFSSAQDALTDAAAGWGTATDATLGAHAWLSCGYDPAVGATAAPSARCLFDYGQTPSPAAGQFRLTQAGLTVASGASYEVHYCLRGSVAGQHASVALVDGRGNSLGLDSAETLAPGSFTCATRDFTATGDGPAQLVVRLGDPLAATHTMDFGTDVDDSAVQVALPFPVITFATAHSSMSVGTNGYLAFVGDAHTGDRQHLPDTSAPNGVVAPWWDDLKTAVLPGTPTVPANFVQWKVDGAAPARVLTVEWNGIVAYGGSSPPVTFDARFTEDGRVELHYKPLANPTGSAYSASVGLESDDGTAGVSALACGSTCHLSDFPGGQAISFVPEPDLVVAGLTAPSLAHANLPAPFSVTLKNQGTLPASGVVGRVYLSHDRTFDPGDTSVWEVGPVSLDRGQGKSFSNAAVLIPDTLPAGVYYPIAVVDPDAAITELDETNNVQVGDPIRVGPPAPDFTPTNVVLHSTQAAPGGTVEVTATLANLGNLPGHCPWRIVLSLNTVLSTADRTVASGAVDLDGGATFALDEQVSLPADLQPGLYRVGILLDAEPPPALGTEEIDEFNNTASAADTLLVSGPASIVTTSLPAATVGATYGFRLQASGGDGLYLWGLADGTHLPAGLTLSPFGDVSGIPTTAGDATFAVALTTNQTEVHKQTFTLHVGTGTTVLDFVTSELPAAIYGREYEEHLVATGGTPPYTFALVVPAGASGLPAGMAFDGSGMVSGVPVSGGDFTLSFHVTDAASHEAERDVVLHVLPPGRPVIDARPLPEALLDKSYTATLAAVGGTTPYAWVLEKVRRLGTGSAPSADLDKVPGLNVGADGSISGTPREVGMYALIVKVTDASGSTDRDTLLLEVRADQGLAILTTEMPKATIGKDYDEQIVAAGGEGQVTFSLVGDAALPDGLALHPDGRVVGRATAAVRRTVLVHVVDEAGREDYQALTLEAMAPKATTTSSSGCDSAGAGPLALLGLALVFLRRRRVLASSAAALVGALVLVSGCGTPPPRSPCAGVSCQPGEQCDPADGICKCGGVSGRACTSEESCNPQTLSCELLDRCRLVECSAGMSCDPSDGTCRCAGGPVCVAGEVCDAAAQRCVAADVCANVTCGAGLTCDPADGSCKCGGPGGKACNAGERCVSGACTADPCASVACSGGESCDPADATCKCGGAGGVACLYGQTCQPADKKCVASALCASVRCTGGSSCDPADGTCKCGGAGGEVCTNGQTCDLPSLTCVGGNRCFNTQCPANTQCDPEDGACHCGAGGPVCGDGESCDASTTVRTCRKVCDPLTQSPCGSSESCGYDVATKQAFCGTAGSKAEGATCSATAECGRGMHCYTRLSSSGTCRYYCANLHDTCPGSTNTCRQLPGATIGVCAP